MFYRKSLVITKEGLKRIDEIQEGELVLAKDTNTGNIDYKKVLQVYRKSASRLVHINAEGEEITTTPTHLFFMEDGNWKKETKYIHLQGN